MKKLQEKQFDEMDATPQMFEEVWLVKDSCYSSLLGSRRGLIINYFT